MPWPLSAPVPALCWPVVPSPLEDPPPSAMVPDPSVAPVPEPSVDVPAPVPPPSVAVPEPCAVVPDPSVVPVDAVSPLLDDPPLLFVRQPERCSGGNLMISFRSGLRSRHGRQMCEQALNALPTKKTILKRLLCIQGWDHLEFLCPPALAVCNASAARRTTTSSLSCRCIGAHSHHARIGWKTGREVAAR